ncbi:hypothetical protein [Jiulongibacter sp. NS-SX5]|uniref:hypothetical protein n=1 Tax=Jiulongibacter sp. NS-SX5 TaxID=3463854 RepID=UPI0040587993
MKKQALIILFGAIALASPSFAQHILKSDFLYQDEIHTSHYMYIRSEAKTVESDWETYLSKLGKVDNSKGEITVDKIKSGGLSSYLDKVVSIVVDNKDFVVINTLFLDENGKSLDDAQFDHEALDKLFYDFYDLAYFNEEVRMAETDLAWAEDLKDVAEKNKGKAERSLEANIRAQERLGKKIDKSPEELSKVIQKKDAVFQELLKSEVEEETEELQEEVEKQEKKLVKIKDKKERDADKLQKREEEFPELTDKLFAAREALEKAVQVVESKKLVLQELKAK